jgi:midasin (ATPase involved in ribosome maturation)
MSVKINTIELRAVLERTPCHHNIMLVGKHGIGKSQIIERWFVAQGKHVATLFLGQMSDPGDLIGLPMENSDTGKTDFRPPYWFPTDGKPIVLFLDELNRARPEILQAVMDLALNKTLAGKRLPEGSQIISAVNEGEEYQLTDLDPALVSRFNIYVFAPTVAEWLLWATESKIDQRIIDFIDKNTDMLESSVIQDAGLEKTPDRRAWQRVSELISGVNGIDKIMEKTIAGLVGVSVALKFSAFDKSKHGINAKSVLTNFEKQKAKLEKADIHELAALNEAIFRTIETEDDVAIVKKYIANLESYIRWLCDSKRKEPMAHWTTLYDSAAYPKTKVAVITQSPYIFANIVQFIKDIKV